MSSDSFNEESKSLRPTVQVGDPFTEKLLLEACMELFKTDYVVGIQDMGARGLQVAHLRWRVVQVVVWLCTLIRFQQERRG